MSDCKGRGHEHAWRTIYQGVISLPNELFYQSFINQLFTDNQLRPGDVSYRKRALAS